jgi:hypothetical protein
MFDFFELFKLAQLRAINLALNPTAESIWRIKLRNYSERFHTPLHLCEKLDPLYILQALNEDQYNPSIVDEELEELLDIVYKEKNPNYSRMSQEDIEALVDNVLNRELARAAKKKPPTQQTIQNEVKAAEVKPRSGGMSFGDLEKLEAKSEHNKAAFDES